MIKHSMGDTKAFIPLQIKVDTLYISYDFYMFLNVLSLINRHLLLTNIIALALAKYA